MLDLYEELRQVVRVLTCEGICYALAGGLAVSYYDRPRATVDIDLVLVPQDWERCRDALSPLGYREYAMPMTFAKGQISIRRLTKLEEGGPDYLVVDVLMVRGHLEQEIWENRQAVLWEDMTVWMVSKSALIHLKELRGSKQDLLDIERLEGGGREE